MGTKYLANGDTKQGCGVEQLLRMRKGILAQPGQPRTSDDNGQVADMQLQLSRHLHSLRSGGHVPLANQIEEHVARLLKMDRTDKKAHTWSQIAFLVLLSGPLPEPKPDPNNETENPKNGLCRIQGYGSDVFQSLPDFGNRKPSWAREVFDLQSQKPGNLLSLETPTSLFSLLDRLPGIPPTERHEFSGNTQSENVPLARSLLFCQNGKQSDTENGPETTDRLFGALSHTSIHGFGLTQAPIVDLSLPNLPKDGNEDLWSFTARHREKHPVTLPAHQAKHPPSSTKNHEEPRNSPVQTSETPFHAHKLPQTRSVFLSEHGPNKFDQAYTEFRTPSHAGRIYTVENIWSGVAQSLAGLPSSVCVWDRQKQCLVPVGDVRGSGWSSGAMSSLLEVICEVGSNIRRLEQFAQTGNAKDDCVLRAYRTAMQTYVQIVRAYILSLVDAARKQPQPSLFALMHTVQPLRVQLSEVVGLCGISSPDGPSRDPPSGITLIDQIFDRVMQGLQPALHFQLFFLQACLAPFMSLVESLLFAGILSADSELLGLCVDKVALNSQSEAAWTKSLSWLSAAATTPRFMGTLAEPILRGGRAMLLLMQMDASHRLLTHSLHHPAIRGALNRSELSKIEAEWAGYESSATQPPPSIPPLSNQPSIHPQEFMMEHFHPSDDISHQPSQKIQNNAVPEASTQSGFSGEDVDIPQPTATESSNTPSQNTEAKNPENGNEISEEDPVVEKARKDLLALNRMFQSLPSRTIGENATGDASARRGFDLLPSPSLPSSVGAPTETGDRFLPLILRDSLALPLQIQSGLLNAASLQILLDRYGLMGHLLAVRRYILMADGVFFDHLCAGLFNKISLGVVPSASEGYMLLLGALDASQATTDPHSQSLGLATDLPGHPDWPPWAAGPGPGGAITVAYKVTFPTNIILSDWCMHTCYRIHRLLFAVRFTEWTLLDVTKTLMLRRRALDLRNPWLRRMLCHRHECLTFVQTTRHSMQHQVSDVCWDDFQASMKKATDIEQLRGAHESYIRAMATACFVIHQAQPALEAFHEALSAVTDFGQLIKRWLSTDTGTLRGDVEEAILRASAAIRLWHAVSSKLAARDYATAPHLSALATQLDFNGYYSRMASVPTPQNATPLHV